MIRALQLSQLVELLPECLGAQLYGDNVSFERVCTDSRQLQKGDLFVALRGERFDAHDFLGAVAEGGAGALVVEHFVKDISIAQLKVADTTRALGEIAALARQDFQGPLVAITGSCGKTTVKEMLVSIFSQHCGSPQAVHATQGNLNNHIGVPLTLLNLQPEHRASVVEMGASGLGEIGYLTALGRPKVAAVLNVMGAHIEGFGSIEGVARAKFEIYSGLPDDGVAIVNLDDDYASDYVAKLGGKNLRSFSVYDSSANVYACEILEKVGRGTEFTLCCNGQRRRVRLHVLGQHNLSNALAAASCALAAGVDLDNIVSGLEAFSAVAGRLVLSEGVSGCTVLDDSYNANPGSVRAAIDSIKNIPARKILVLGDMAELGESAEREHAAIGRYALEAGIDELYSIGRLAACASEAFGTKDKNFSSQSDLSAALLSQAQADCLFLIKGSRSARMEVVAQALQVVRRGEQA